MPADGALEILPATSGCLRVCLCVCVRERERGREREREKAITRESVHVRV